MRVRNRLCGFLCMLTAVFGPAAPVRAAISIDLSHVDLQSVEYQRFKTSVDQAVAGSPGHAFSATDAATMYRLTGQTRYATLAVQMIEAQVADAEAAIELGKRPEVAAIPIWRSGR